MLSDAEELAMGPGCGGCDADAGARGAEARAFLRLGWPFKEGGTCGHALVKSVSWVGHIWQCTKH